MDFLSKGIAAIAVVILVTLIMGFPLMFLWNWLMPVIFHLPMITFWQALGLSALSSMLIKSSSATIQ